MVEATRLLDAQMAEAFDEQEWDRRDRARLERFEAQQAAWAAEEAEDEREARERREAQEMYEARRRVRGVEPGGGIPFRNCARRFGVCRERPNGPLVGSPAHLPGVSPERRVPMVRQRRATTVDHGGVSSLHGAGGGRRTRPVLPLFARGVLRAPATPTKVEARFLALGREPEYVRWAAENPTGLSPWCGGKGGLPHFALAPKWACPTLL
jgi:hypothetical protein